MDNVSLTPELSRKVFGNPLIMEKILHFVIFDGKKLVKNDIKNCKLVNMNWLQFTSTTLRKLGLPLFSIPFGQNVCRSSTDIGQDVYFDRFIDTWGTSWGTGDPVPPFSVTILPCFRITEDSVDKFVNFMVEYGQSVSHLDIQWTTRMPTEPCKDVSLPTQSARIRLPNLKKLTTSIPGKEDLTEALLLQHIIAGMEQLDTLVLTTIQNAKLFQNLIENHCQHVLHSLRKLNIDTIFMSAGELEVLLLKTHLPNLTEIEFNFFPLVLNNWSKIVYEILNRFRLKLKKLHIGGHYPYLFGEAVEMKFPVMPKLTQLFINNPRYTPPTNLSRLEQCLPAVEEMSFLCETVPALLQWLQNSQLDSVEKVSLELDDPCSAPGISFPLVQQLRRTFPQVADLTVEMSGRNFTSVVQAIFQEMCQLKKLNVKLQTPEQVMESQYWDAIFLGVTKECVLGLQSFPHLRDAVHMELDQRIEPSIVNLSELTTLKLRSDDNALSRISDVTFYFGFLCMPNLQQVELDFPLELSDDIKMQWRAQGRKLNGC